MAVTTTKSGNITAYEGTLTEVLDAVNAHNTQAEKVLGVFHNGTNYSAVVWGN